MIRGQSISNIFIHSDLIGVSHFGAPHKEISAASSKTLWELMLALNQNETSAKDFRQTISDFLDEEYYQLQIQIPAEPVAYANWEYTYRFIRTKPPVYLSQEDMFQHLDDWIGIIVIQTVDHELTRQIAEKGVGTALYSLPSLSIPLDEYWNWYKLERSLPENNNSPDNTDGE